MRVLGGVGEGCTLPDLCMLWEELWPGDFKIYLSNEGGGGKGAWELAGLFISNICRRNTGQRRQSSSGKAERRTLLLAQLADPLGSLLTS